MAQSPGRQDLRQTASGRERTKAVFRVLPLPCQAGTGSGLASAFRRNISTGMKAKGTREAKNSGSQIFNDQFWVEQPERNTQNGEKGESFQKTDNSECVDQEKLPIRCVFAGIQFVTLTV